MTAPDLRAAARPFARAAKRVLIVEPHASGHHATYLRWVVEGVIARGWTAVVATTAEALEHPQLQNLACARGGVELRTIDFSVPVSANIGRLDIVRQELAHWWAIRRVVRAEVARGTVSAVVLPYVDYCFFACCALGVPDPRVPWHMISMRLTVTAAPMATIPWKWRLARRLLQARSLGTLFAISPSVRRVPAAWLTSEMSRRLRYLPDPAEQRGSVDRNAARARLGLGPDRIAVLVFGSIDERKGLNRLGDALAADPALEPYVVVVAGKQSATLQQALAAEPFVSLRRQRRVIEMDRVIDDAEQALVFAAADIVWLGYEGHMYMSGVLVLAGLAALPVVATDDGEVGAFVREQEIGLLIEARGNESVCTALRRLLDEPLRHTFGRRVCAALASHTPADFKHALIAAIEERS